MFLTGLFKNCLGTEIYFLLTKIIPFSFQETKHLLYRQKDISIIGAKYSQQPKLGT